MPRSTTSVSSKPRRRFRDTRQPRARPPASTARVRAKIVCGAANNQLVSEQDGVRLAERGILYAPDCVVNAGGIINVAAEHLGWDEAEVVRRVDGTAERLARVLARADQLDVAPNLAADGLARERVRQGTALAA